MRQGAEPRRWSRQPPRTASSGGDCGSWFIPPSSPYRSSYRNPDRRESPGAGGRGSASGFIYSFSPTYCEIGTCSVKTRTPPWKTLIVAVGPKNGVIWSGQLAAEVVVLKTTCPFCGVIGPLSPLTCPGGLLPQRLVQPNGAFTSMFVVWLPRPESLPWQFTAKFPPPRFTTAHVVPWSVTFSRSPNAYAGTARAATTT